MGTTLTGDDNSVAIGRENLQGAYLVQQAFNRTPSGMKVLLLIANSGSDEAYAGKIAQQIATIAQNDRTVVGVMGWSLTAQSLDAYGSLTKAHIPMVSTAGGDGLTGISPYFFRVAPSAQRQADVAAQYTRQILRMKTVAIFSDENNPYSSSLARDFGSAFTAMGGRVVATEPYTIKQPNTILHPLTDALQKHPSLLYLAGYPRDANVVFAHLPSSGPLVMGGNALYQLGGYAQDPLTQSEMKGHLYLTALAYPDAWDALRFWAKKPSFFTYYQQTYDPSKKHLASPYGYDRADSGVMLAYDATSVLLGASSTAYQAGPLTGKNLQRALAEITGNNAFQGVSGQISFGTNGDPMDKAVMVVCFTKEGYFKLDVVQGKFLKDGEVLPGKPFGACS